MYSRYPTLYVFCTVDGFHAGDGLLTGNSQLLAEHSIPSELLKKENLEQTSALIWHNLLQHAQNEGGAYAETRVPFDCFFPNDEKISRRLLCTVLADGGPAINTEVGYSLYGREILNSELAHATTSTEATPRIVYFAYNLTQPMSSKEIVAELLAHSSKLSIRTVSYIGLIYNPEKSLKELEQYLAIEKEFTEEKQQRGFLKPSFCLDKNDDDDEPFQSNPTEVVLAEKYKTLLAAVDKDRYKLLGTASAESPHFSTEFKAAHQKRR